MTMPIEGRERSGTFVADAAAACIAIILGLIAEYLFHGKPIGASFPAFAVLCAAGLVLALRLRGRSLPRSAWIVMLPLVGFSGMLAFRANPALACINVACSFGSFLLLVSVASGRKVRDYDLSGYAKLVARSIAFIPSGVRTAVGLWGYGTRDAKRGRVRQFLKGALIALPFLLAFGALFASADLAFDKFFRNLLSGFSFLRFQDAVFWVFIAAAFLLGAYVAAGKTHEDPSGAEAVPESGSDHVLSISTSLALVNALFLAFIVFQVEYLFGGAGNVGRLGLTYATYARRGFFELLAVTGLSFLMLLGFERLLSGKGGGHAKAFKALSSVHVLLVGAVIASAHQRLVLYEDAYGFTTPRFFAHAFVFLLGAMFLVLAAKIVLDRDGRWSAFRLLAAAAVFCACLDVINPDAFVAARNLERYRQTGKIDATYLAGLSSDAIPTAIVLLDVKDPDVAVRYAEGLRRNPYVRALSARPWYAFDFSDAAAASLLRARASDAASPKGY